MSKCHTHDRPTPLQWRQAHDLKIRKMGELVGMDIKNLSNIEQGHRGREYRIIEEDPSVRVIEETDPVVDDDGVISNRKRIVFVKILRDVEIEYVDGKLCSPYNS